MFAILVLGARQSGKSTLACTCLTKQSTHRPLRPDSPRAFHVITPDRTQHAQILDPKPNAAKTSMLRELTSQNVVAALLVLPRDAHHPIPDILEWATFARQLQPCPQLAVVVTKTRASEPPLPLHRFEQTALNCMRASDVHHIFYTDAETTPPVDLRGWLEDILDQTARDTIGLENVSPWLGPADDPILAPLPLLSEYTTADEQRTCDHCLVA